MSSARFNAEAVRVEDLIPKGAMGDHNTLRDLQNYVVGPAPGGLVLAPDGSLDMARSFARVDYFSLLGDLSVRNNVQAGVDKHPVDFVAVRIPAEEMRDSLREDERADQVIWLYGGREREPRGRGADDVVLQLVKSVVLAHRALRNEVFDVNGLRVEARGV